jgi:hypothetical protein
MENENYLVETKKNITCVWLMVWGVSSMQSKVFKEMECLAYVASLTLIYL